MKEIKSLQNTTKNKQPSNLEAEQALLGSILVNNDIIDEVSNIINPTSFYDPAHTKIYEVIETLNNKGMIANPITLKNYFEKEKQAFKVYAKSGSLRNNHILAGYIYSKSNRPYAFVISVNNYRSGKKAIQNTITNKLKGLYDKLR